MKKTLVLGIALALLLSGCDAIAERSEVLKKTRTERDSIQTVQQQQLAEMEEYMDLIQKVNDGFDAIRTEQNYIAVNSDMIEGEPSLDMQSRVADGFAMVNRLLEENKARIEELEAKVKRSGIQSARLQKTISDLTTQLEQKNIEISALQYELERRDFRIDSLLAENTTISARAADLEAQTIEQNETIAGQDAAINRAYYILANKKELKEKGIDTKKMSAAFRDQYFTAIDVREFNVLHINSKTAKILTKHPVGSYELERGSDKKYTLRISNPNDFWSVSKYLIIQTN